MKKLKIILIALGLLAGSFAISTAATCTNVFPISLNGYVSGACIPSAWGNALEAKLGITGSAATSSLDYQINHIFTSYGSESITSSSLPWIQYSTASLPSSTWVVSSTNIVNTFNGATGTRTYGVTSANPFISVTTSTSNATLTFSSSSLNLGTISSYASTDYLPSSTVYVSSIDGSTGGAYSLSAGTNVSIATTSNSATISVTSPTSTVAAGSANDIQFNSAGTLGADTGLFQYSSSSKQLTLSAPTSSAIIGSSTYFTTSSVQTISSFSYTGATSSFTVPSGVTSIVFHAVGGGTTDGGTATGLGGAATGTLSVTAGEKIYFAVGGGVNATTTGGYPGGGLGTLNCSLASGGGGMTWVATSTGTFSTSTAVLVAAGAGGVDGNNADNGGSGGGLTGSSGGGANPGSGGSQSAGGASGGGSATAGSAGQGGNGSSGGCNVTGAGGGAGYYGGGGGNGSSGASSGGGGSSYMSSQMTSTSTAASSNTGNGSLTLTYNAPLNGLSDNFALALGGEIITGGSTPTVSAVTGGVTVTGNNTAGSITNNSSTASVTLIFSTSTPYSNPAYFNAPICTASVASGTAYAIKVFSTTTSTVLTPTSNFVTSTIMNYICLGR